ncbi:phage tail tape measure protein [Brevibacterium sp. JNUCC-42]|nr:phage tail tape measure protein [Brevibacterium sp. JNUCC-42]
MGAIGNLMFAIGFKVAKSSLTKASQDIDKFKGKTRSAADEAEKASSKFSKLGKSMVIAGGIVAGGVATGMGAIGVATWKAANQSQEAFRIMRTGTGATGEQLDSLMQSYRNLGSQVPDDLNTVAKVMADLNTRTGATGKTLEEMSGKILSLTAVAGVNADNMITQSTRMMGDWSLQVDKGGETLDKLFYVSQNTGIGMEALAEKMTKFGGPLRQMGFDFDTSAVLMGKWEKEGVNAELVLGSLRIALGKMAKDGVKDTNKALTNVINKIKQTKTVGEGTALAMEAFGAKAGPDMAAAIKEGRFELGELVAGMQNSKGIIDENYAETETFGDKIATLMNKINIGLGPLGDKITGMAEKAFPFITKLFDDMSLGFDNCLPHIESFAAALGTGIENTIRGASATIGFFKENIDILGPAIGAIALVIGVGLIPTLWGMAKAGWAAVAPWLPLIGIALVVGAVVAGVIWTFKNWGKVSDWLTQKWTQFKNWIFGVFQSIGNFFGSYWPYALALLTGPLAPLVMVVIAFWDEIESFTVGIFTSIGDYLSQTWNSICSTISGFANQIWTDISGNWNTIIGFLQGINLFDIGQNIIQGLLDGITNMTDAVWESVTNIASGIKDKITGFLDIHSPSRVMMELGMWTSEGLAQGIQQGESSVLGSSEELAQAVEQPHGQQAYSQSLTPALAPATSVSRNAVHSTAEVTVNLTVNGGSPTIAQDIKEQVELAIANVFESLSRRQGIPGAVE